MIQRYKILVLSLFLSLWASALRAQEPKTTWLLNTDESSDTKKYVARESIILQSNGTTAGFKFTADPANPGKTFSAKIDQTLVFPPAENTYTKPDGTITTDPTQGGIVGSIPGHLNVNSRGASTYNFPIECPSGIMGMQPNMSLEYNSQSGDGPYGIGWNLNGLSVLHKSIKNIFSDGSISGVEDDNSNVYLLDEVRLFVKDLVVQRGYYTESDQVSYNTTVVNLIGSTYETQNKDYSKIESFGIAGYINDDINLAQPWTILNKGPRSFKVTSKNGIKSEYTVSPDVYDHNDKQPLTWYLNKITDTNGNYMSYNYLTDEGQTILKNIIYTGNANTQPFDSIVFNYDTKPASYTYIGSTQIANKFLLNNIQIKYNNTVLKQYNFTYITRNNKYYLNDVTLTGQNNLKLNATTFQWGNDNSVIAVTKLNTPQPFQSQLISSSDKHWLSADINGDGLTDEINIYPVTTVQNGISQTKNYLQIFKAVMTNGQVSFVNDAYYDVGDNFSYNDLKSLNPSIQFADLYGNNKNEIIVSQLSGSTISFNILGGVAVQQTLQTSSGMPVYAVGDINNDGKEEIIYIEKGKVNNSYYPGKIGYSINGQMVWEDQQFTLPNAPTSIIVSDFDADGLKDLMILTYDSHQAYKNNGGTIQSDGILHPLFSTKSVNNVSIKSNCNVIKTGDFNGDGLTDFVINHLNSSYWELAINDGNWGFRNIGIIGIESSAIDNDPSHNKQKDCIVTDYNHDGKSDVVLTDIKYDYLKDPVWVGDDVYTNYIYNKTSVTWYKCTGSDFSGEKTIYTTDDNSVFNKNNITLGDFDGDGRDDILTYGYDIYNGNDKSDHLYLHGSFNSNFEANLLKSVTNGIGKTSQITYQPLTYSTTSDNKNFYTKGSSSVYPLCDIQVPQYCVSKISEPNGQGGSIITNFEYNGARILQTGMGFLGFNSRTVTNTSNNFKSVTTTDIESTNYLTNKVTQVVSTTDNIPISKKEITITNTKTGNIVESLQTKEVTTDNLKGLSSTTEYLAYDNYGNPTSIKTTQGNIIINQTISYVQKGSWCPNKPESVTIKKTLINGDSETRIRNYSYDTNGNLTGEIIDAGDTNQQSVVYSGFNIFGQPTIATTTANSITRTASIVMKPSGRFIQSKTDLLGNTTSYDWGDESLGLLKSQTDRLGTTNYTYNGLGQLTQTLYPNGIRKVTDPQWASTGNAYNAKYYIYNESSGTAPLYTWCDVLGREVVKETTGLNGKKVRVFSEYDANGRLLRVSEPTFGSITESWATTYDQYDSFGRPTKISTPLGQTTIGYNLTTTSVTSPTGSKQTVLNSAGQVQSSTVNGKKVTYDYYPSGLAKTATPEGGQAIAMNYDLQGHRTSLTDPDAGTVVSTYNGFGELLTETQKGRNGTDTKLTTNTYEKLTGLLKNIVRGTETTSYVYDNINRLSTIEIAGKNKQTFTYGDFDRVVSVKEEIGSQVYNKQVEYDVLGRTKKEIFPSGYYVTNTYDIYGNLTEVKDNINRSIWKAVDANSRGQFTKENKGIKETDYGFDNQGRTTSIFATNVVDLSYDYNGGMNLFSRTDNRIHQTEQFGYDALNRLTSWDLYTKNTNNTLTDLNHDNSITYDATTGNLATKSDLGVDALGHPFQMNYAEKKADGTNCGPHALTTIMGQPANFPTADLNVTYTDFKKISSATGIFFEFAHPS